MIHQIEGGLYQRQAIASKITNFEARLPASQSELALQTMKDPYLFDFIPLKENMLERDIEQDHPSIGLLLCKSKNDLVAEYSLKDMSKPIGVSAYRITSCLKSLKSSCLLLRIFKSGFCKADFPVPVLQWGYYFCGKEGLPCPLNITPP